MPSSAVDICNKALARIGVKDFIEGLEDETAEAVACNALYSTARDTALAALWWPFATKRAELALLADHERTGWEYVYALPADCLVARFIWMGERAPNTEDKVPFGIELNDDDDGRVLCTDKEDAVLVYTAAVTNPLIFPPIFVDALSWLLASELALPLAVRPDLREQAIRMWASIQTRAAAVAFSEQHEALPPSTLISGRE